MKILFYYPGTLASLRRGTPIRSYKLYSFLAVDHDVHIVATKFPDEFLGKGIAIPSVRKGWNWLSSIRTLRRVIRETAPDVIYGQTHRSLFALYFASGKTPVCVDLHGLHYEEYSANACAKFIRKTFFAFLIRKVKGITATCQALIDIHATSSITGHRLPGGVDMKMIDSVKAEKLGVVTDPIVAYCGNLSDYQGVDYLVSALASIRSIPWHFLFVCSSQEDKARVMLQEYGIEERTTLFSALPQQRVFALLKGSDIAVVPRPDIAITRYSFPSKMTECLGSGAAVIATDVSDARYMVENDRTGWLVEPGNTLALVHALTDALNREEKRRRLSYAAQQRMRKEYDWPVVIDHLSSFLYSLTHE